jgi:hypothetical protein
MEDFNSFMVKQNPTFKEGVKYCATKGLTVSEPTVSNHCYKHITGFKKKETHVTDNVEKYGGQVANPKNVTIPHSFDPQTLRTDLGVLTDANDPQTVKEVIARGLNKSIELATLSLVNALNEHSLGQRQYPLDMIRGLKDLVAICCTLTTGKTGSNRYDSIVDIEGLIKKPVQKAYDPFKELEEAGDTVTVWE